MSSTAMFTEKLFSILQIITRITKRLVIDNLNHKSTDQKAWQNGHRQLKQTLLVWLLALGFVFSSMTVFAEVTYPDRRRDQFPDSTAHLVVPLPYSYPGIGDGFFLMGNLSNVMQTTADFLAMIVTGDAGGHILQLDELPIIDQRLYLKLYYQDIDRVVVNQYDTRGMDGTDKNDFNLLDATLALEKTAELNLTFFERRLNFIYEHTATKFNVKSIRDHNGALITELDEPFHGKGSRDVFSIAVDLTDDYLDPLEGMRFSLHYQDNPAKKAEDPSYYVLTYNLLYYQPVFTTDTLVFNYFQSGAHVRKKGNTNPADIRQELGFNCDPLDAECLDSEQKLVDVLISDRTHGSAANLGGKERLRSYPDGRFQGGHSAFFGVEYRWNFKREVKPFDYLFWKDVRTGLQLAFFAEVGSVSEKAGDLWDDTRYSAGTGFRITAASGAVYRADIGIGDEGSELTVFFFYPW